MIIINLNTIFLNNYRIWRVDSFNLSCTLTIASSIQEVKQQINGTTIKQANNNNIVHLKAFDPTPYFTNHHKVDIESLLRLLPLTESALNSSTNTSNKSVKHLASNDLINEYLSKFNSLRSIAKALQDEKKINQNNKNKNDTNQFSRFNRFSHDNISTLTKGIIPYNINNNNTNKVNSLSSSLLPTNNNTAASISTNTRKSATIKQTTLQQNKQKSSNYMITTGGNSNSNNNNIGGIKKSNNTNTYNNKKKWYNYNRYKKNLTKKK